MLADGTIQLMLGHADIRQTQRYLNITDEEPRKSVTGVWERRRQLRLAGQTSRSEATGEQRSVNRRVRLRPDATYETTHGRPGRRHESRDHFEPPQVSRLSVGR